jgi:hypothetical protein
MIKLTGARRLGEAAGALSLRDAEYSYGLAVAGSAEEDHLEAQSLAGRTHPFLAGKNCFDCREIGLQ